MINILRHWELYLFPQKHFKNWMFNKTVSWYYDVLVSSFIKWEENIGLYKLKCSLNFKSEWCQCRFFTENYHAGQVFHLTSFPLVFRGFDKDNDGCVNVLEWIHGLSLFLRGSLEEKMKCKIADCPIGLYFMNNISKALKSVSFNPDSKVSLLVGWLVGLNPTGLFYGMNSSQ